VADWKKTVEGVAATALAVIAMSIFARMVWNGWDRFILFLVENGFNPIVEYILGAALFILAVWLGVIQLKKLKKKMF